MSATACSAECQVFASGASAMSRQNDERRAPDLYGPNATVRGMGGEEYVKECTRLLRHEADPYWNRVRECLRLRGVDPATTILATSFPDDSSFDFGVLVTADGEVIEFGFDYLNVDMANGAITEWTTVTDRWRDRPARADVAKAFDVLAIEGPWRIAAVMDGAYVAARPADRPSG